MEKFICVGFALPLIIGLFILVYQLNTRSAAAEAREKARKEYLDSLEMLKRDPNNAGLREKTLALGRSKVKVPAGPGLVEAPLVDELALMNDINAACARAVSNNISQEPTGKPSVEERLVKLDELRSKRLITEEEYQSRRKQILDEL
jgi:hypothetical protein